MVEESGEQVHDGCAIEPFGDAVDVVLKLFCLLGTHSCEDVRGAGRQRGLAEAVMRNRISPGITVLR